MLPYEILSTLYWMDPETEEGQEVKTKAIQTKHGPQSAIMLQRWPTG